MEIQTYGARRILKNAPTSPRGTLDARLLKPLPRMLDVQGGVGLEKPFEFASIGQKATAKSYCLSLTKSLSASSVLVACFSPKFSEWQSKSSGSVIVLLFLYSVDEQCGTSLVRSVRILSTRPIPEASHSRLKSAWDSGTPFAFESLFQKRRGVFTILVKQPLFVNTGFDRAPPVLCYHLFESIKSLFGFLKYAGPRRLPPSRKILLDEEGYHITHIGKGAFAVISRVLYRPTGDVRVMKRITFDESGLAKYLAKNEVDALKAMAGNIWFPQLLNDFAEGRQFVITMVRSVPAYKIVSK